MLAKPSPFLLEMQPLNIFSNYHFQPETLLSLLRLEIKYKPHRLKLFPGTSNLDYFVKQ